MAFLVGAVTVAPVRRQGDRGVAELMMEVPLADGHSVVVEVDRRGVPGELVLAAAKPYEVAARATETLEQTLDKVRPALHSLTQWARSAEPDECCVEFGLKLGGPPPAATVRRGCSTRSAVPSRPACHTMARCGRWCSSCAALCRSTRSCWRQPASVLGFEARRSVSSSKVHYAASWRRPAIPMIGSSR